MTPTLPPVPEDAFPVYGLAAGFRGERSVDVWNRLGDGQTDPVWNVALAHTSDGGQFVVVITDGKLIAPAYTDAPSRQETALGDVAREALLGLASTADISEVEPDSIPSLAEINSLAEAIGEPPWQSTNLDVDGRATPFWIYRAGEHVAACADIGAVAIGLFGKQADQLVAAVPLVPVNETLRAYSLPQIF
jgi:hypothetical protein